MRAKDHWELLYSTRDSAALSWYQNHAARSLRLIHETGAQVSAPIIDVGGGASTLVDDLLGEGYTDLTVLDLSAAALVAARARLGARAGQVRWVEADVMAAALPAHHFDIWHDRAVFHFLISPQDRQAYVQAVLDAVRPGGHVIVATFGMDGPTECSGLPVRRYTADGLHSEFGEPFTLLRHEQEDHRTPWGTVQQFIYCYCRRQGS
ncbi:MAG: class I SAM-dependent methyltransferase [Candidatus Eisenbacteria bacterium]